MLTHTIDCAKIRNEADFWEIFIATVEPEGTHYFGKNLDAFWDGLNGGPGWPGECTLHFVNTQAIRQFRDGQFYSALCRIASESKYISVYVE